MYLPLGSTLFAAALDGVAFTDLMDCPRVRGFPGVAASWAGEIERVYAVGVKKEHRKGK